MKKIELGQTITILANLGVIAGILFLGIELQQNNQLMEAEAREARNQRLIEINRDIYAGPGFAELLVKAGRGETLTEAEEHKLFAFGLMRLRMIEAQYLDSLEGNIANNVRGYRAAFRGEVYNAPMGDAWERSKSTFREDFVQFMEENVVNER